MVVSFDRLDDRRFGNFIYTKCQNSETTAFPHDVSAESIYFHNLIYTRSFICDISVIAQIIILQGNTMQSLVNEGVVACLFWFLRITQK